MSSGRSHGRPPGPTAGQGVLWGLEVVPVASRGERLVTAEVAVVPAATLDESVTSLGERRASAEVARLFDLAAREPEAIRQLDGCVALLREVQAAKTALTRLSPDQLRAGLARRRQILTSDTA